MRIGAFDRRIETCCTMPSACLESLAKNTNRVIFKLLYIRIRIFRFYDIKTASFSTVSHNLHNSCLTEIP